VVKAKQLVNCREVNSENEKPVDDGPISGLRNVATLIKRHYIITSRASSLLLNLHFYTATCSEDKDAVCTMYVFKRCVLKVEWGGGIREYEEVF
jgi:hypothetical protein